jgi:tetratricopeptide (TPR) repeat protein
LAQDVLNRNPNHTLARVALALAYGRVGGYDNALTQARQALETAEPQYRIDSLRAQAISQSDLGRYREAMLTMQQAITINNKLAVLQFEYALFALQVSDADTATAAYLNILAFAPTNIKAQLRMCELYSTLRDPETAMRYCQGVVNRAPSWADGWYLLGREYFWQGRFAQAQDAFSRCTALQTAQNIPTQDLHLECWYMQGQSAEILGDCDNLLRIYEEFKGITLRGNLPQTWTYPPEGPAICVGQ